MKRLLCALLCIVWTGCGFTGPDPDPGTVFIPDDDDDSASDDDDVANDDDLANDDDATDVDLRAWAALIQIDNLGQAGAITGSEYSAIASFGSGTPLPFGSPVGLDGRPLLGSMLHPEHAPDLELCEELSSATGMAPLPLTQSVGGLVSIVPSSAAATLELPETGGVYSLEESGELGATLWSLQVKGGADWSPTDLDEVFSMPTPVLDPLPGPGSLGSLGTLQIRWSAANAPQGVEVMLLRGTTIDQSQWVAVRCLSQDDGEMFVPASILAAGSGDIIVTLSRGAWTTEEITSGGDSIVPDIGAVRVLRYLLTPG